MPFVVHDRSSWPHLLSGTFVSPQKWGTLSIDGYDYDKKSSQQWTNISSLLISRRGKSLL
jgi:hypothetical protein